MPPDDVFATASLPEVAVDTEAALTHTRQVGAQRLRRRRTLLAGAGVVLVAVAGAVTGGALVGTDDGGRVETGPDPVPTTPVPPPPTTNPTDPPSATDPTDPTGPAATSPTTTSATTPTTTATEAPPVGATPALDACTRRSVAAAVGYRMDEVLSDPVCHEGWGWIDACPAAERDPEVGCLHAGKILRVVDGRWTVAGALLQDCAESFTAAGAPPAVATRFFDPCFPDDRSPTSSAAPPP